MKVFKSVFLFKYYFFCSFFMQEIDPSLGFSRLPDDVLDEGTKKCFFLKID